MERLTRKSSAGNWHVGHYPVYDAYAKLAAYENTELSPEDILNLKEEVIMLDGKLEELITLNLWQARRIPKVDRNYVYREIEKITGKQFIKFEEIKALENCKNLGSSYGEICVKCNKCGRFDNGEEQQND